MVNHREVNERVTSLAVVSLAVVSEPSRVALTSRHLTYHTWPRMIGDEPVTNRRILLLHLNDAAVPADTSGAAAAAVAGTRTGLGIGSKLS